MKLLAAIVSETFSIMGLGQVLIADRDCTATISLGDMIEIETIAGKKFTTIVHDTMFSNQANISGEPIPTWSLRVDNPDALSNDELRGAHIFADKG